MKQMPFDPLAFEIEIALRGIGKGHRRRAIPHLSEMDAHVSSMEVAKRVRDSWTLVKLVDDASGG